MRVYFLVGWGGGGQKPNVFFCLQIDGPITEGAGERLISGILRGYSNFSSNETRLPH